ncbi:MAG: hypothetical protein ABW208_18055 [Pyrinomonadaceae bacterium]
MSTPHWFFVTVAEPMIGAATLLRALRGASAIFDVSGAVWDSSSPGCCVLAERGCAPADAHASVSANAAEVSLDVLYMFVSLR